MTRSRSNPHRSRSLRRLLACCAAATALVVAAGCSSSGGSGGGTPAASGSGEPTYTVGVIADLTGPDSSNAQYIPAAVKAGVITDAQEGYKINYITADTQSTPAGALTGAQKLVAQDHVFAIIGMSSFMYDVAPYLAGKGIPVVGAANDSSEWSTDPNMFSVFGTPDYSKVVTTTADAFKLLGATNIASIGYGLLPSSADVANQTAIVARQLGMKVGYVNTQVTFGDTNVGPMVLAMKDAGVDGVTTLVAQDTAFAILKGLEQQGANIKVSINFAGYGSDMTAAGPSAQQIAQNQYFTFAYEPVEMHTAATEKFVNALKAAGSTAIPGIAEYQTYLAVTALVTGLKAAGPNPTQAKFIQAMLGITNYNGEGLYGSHTMSFAMKDRGQGGVGADNCYWYVKYVGTTFKLVPGADPICGHVVPGKVGS
jgi:branched-chain amino acid transport system substrate-binding protein